MGVLLYLLLITSQCCFARRTQEANGQVSELIDKLMSFADSKTTKESAMKNGEMKMSEPMNDSNIIYFKAAPTEPHNLAFKADDSNDLNSNSKAIDNLVQGKSSVHDDEINSDEIIEMPPPSRRMMSKLREIDPDQNNISERRLVDFAVERLKKLNPIANTLRSAVDFIPNIAQPRTIGLNEADQDFGGLFQDIERLLAQVTEENVSQRNGDDENLFNSTPFDFRSAQPYNPLLGTDEPKISYRNTYLNRPCRNCKRIPNTLPGVLKMILKNRSMFRSLNQTRRLSDSINKIRARLAMNNLRPYF